MAIQFRQRLSFASESVEYTQLELLPAATSIKTKKGKNGEEDTQTKEFKPVKDAKVEILSINLQSSERGQQLIFRYTTGNDITQDVAFFTLSSNTTLPIEQRITWETTPLFTQTRQLVYKPVNSNFPGLEAISLALVVSEWLMSPAFANHLTVLCDMGHYTPDLVKMLILCISYLEVRDDLRVEEDGRFSKSMNVDLGLVVARFKEQMSGLIEDTPRLSKHLDVSQFTLAPATDSEEIKEIEPDIISDEPEEETNITSEPLPDTSLPIDTTAVELETKPEEPSIQPKNKKK
jgi:hypothetical protein